MGISHRTGDDGGGSEAGWQRGNIAAAAHERLAEVLSGFGNKMIAGRLHISEDTVKSPMKAIFRKLGARDRAHAVALALGRAPLASASSAPLWGPGL